MVLRLDPFEEVKTLNVLRGGAALNEVTEDMRIRVFEGMILEHPGEREPLGRVANGETDQEPLVHLGNATSMARSAHANLDIRLCPDGSRLDENWNCPKPPETDSKVRLLIATSLSAASWRPYSRFDGTSFEDRGAFRRDIPSGWADLRRSFARSNVPSKNVFRAR
jgi:hypothetical protein